MKNDLIERAARSLYRSAPHDFDPNQMGEDATWADLTDQVVAVLQAIRDPSDAMVRDGAGPVWAGSGVKADAKALEVWQTMIDAAIEEHDSREDIRSEMIHFGV